MESIALSIAAFLFLYTGAAYAAAALNLAGLKTGKGQGPATVRKLTEGEDWQTSRNRLSYCGEH